MIKALIIGNTTFPTNLIQGPLAGFTCAPMRVQTWKFSEPAYTSTEMVSATHLIYAKKPSQRYIERDAEEGPLCFQLSGSEPDHIAKATKVVNQIGVEMIELNCGCPVKKIRQKLAGSKLLTDLDRLKKIVSAIRENTDALVSVKIRVSDDSQDQDDILIAQTIESVGADCLVVHGRHWTERYDMPCRYAQIKDIVNSVKIPVIGNGDVKDINSLKTMFSETGCAGVMIARASMGQPWLFKQLTEEMEGRQYTLPSPEIIASIFLDHIERLAILDSPFRALLQARKMGKYYSRHHISNPSDFLEQLMSCTNLADFKSLLNDSISRVNPAKHDTPNNPEHIAHDAGFC